jgi:outer membrane protein OmpA-like peptidoglycan-associated protein
MKALLALLAAAQVAAPDTQPLRFVTCPIYRDTDNGRKSGCWLADRHETGVRYDVTSAPSKPDWNYAILVEGRPAGPDAGNPCGGVVLDPVRTSILFDQPCTRPMIPAEGYPGRKFVLPRRVVAPLGAPVKVPPPPYHDRTFHLFFDFDRDFVIYEYDDYLLDQAITWIRAARPRAITVTGYAAVDAPDASGQTVSENAGIARARAERVTEALVRLGVDPAIVTTHWATDPQPIDDPAADGLIEPSKRRVDIATTF